MTRDTIYRVVVFPKDDSEIKSLLETSNKDEAIAFAKELVNHPNTHNVVVSEFELHWTRMVFQTHNVRE